MPYYRNIPTSNQRMSNSQPQLLNNTNVVDDSFNRDHVPHADVFEGKHADMHITVLKKVPKPNTVANDIELFNFFQNNIRSLFIRRGLDANGHMIDAKSITSFAQAPRAAFNWTQLPSGVILKAGYNGANAPAAVTIRLNQGDGTPAYTNPPLAYCAVVTDIATHIYGYEIYIRNVTADELTIRSPGTPGNLTTGFNWFTIGI